MELRSIIESLLFASPKGLTPGDIREILKSTAEHSEEAWIKKLATTRERSIESEIRQLAGEYEELGRPYQLRCIAGKWQFYSLPDFSPWLQVLLGRRQRPPRLTQPALETLSIIAYRQPITRPGIEKIRGVSIDGVMGKLMERGLVEEIGKSDMPGKPVLYGTTALFLEYFGLSNLEELPDAGMLKSISADPNAPLESPVENLHKVANPEELSEWGIEDTLALAPNEPPEEEELDQEDEDDEEEFVDDDEDEYDDEDEDDDEFDDDDEEEDDEVEYASRSAAGLKTPTLSASEEEILSGTSSVSGPCDTVEDGLRIQLVQAQDSPLLALLSGILADAAAAHTPSPDESSASVREEEEEAAELEANSAPQSMPATEEPPESEITGTGDREAEATAASAPDSTAVPDSDLPVTDEAVTPDSIPLQLEPPKYGPWPREFTEPVVHIDLDGDIEVPPQSPPETDDSATAVDPAPVEQLEPGNLNDYPRPQQDPAEMADSPAAIEENRETALDGGMAQSPPAEDAVEEVDTTPELPASAESEVIPEEPSEPDHPPVDSGPGEVDSDTDPVTNELSQTLPEEIPEVPDKPTGAEPESEPESQADTTDEDPGEAEADSGSEKDGETDDGSSVDDPSTALPAPVDPGAEQQTDPGTPEEIAAAASSIEPASAGIGEIAGPVAPAASAPVAETNSGPPAEISGASGRSGHAHQTPPPQDSSQRSFWTRFRDAMNSIEDPSNPVQLIGLFSKKIWQTLNSIARRLTNWMNKSSRR